LKSNAPSAPRVVAEKKSQKPGGKGKKAAAYMQGKKEEGRSKPF